MLGLLCMALCCQPLGALDDLILTFVGDIMAHEANHRICDYRRIFDAVRQDLHSDDLTVGNLETVVDDTRPIHSFPLFNVHQPYLHAVLSSGMDVLSLANNHAYDMGEWGVYRTLDALRLAAGRLGRPVYHSGMRNESENPFEPVAIYRKGARVGFIAATEHLNNWQREQFVYVVNYHVAEEADAFVERVTEWAGRYDPLIVSFHGGREYSPRPLNAKAEFYRRLVVAGADIVYGHHPHVLQPYELVESSGRVGLIIHSAGDFISGYIGYLSPQTPEHPRAAAVDSALLRVTVGRGIEGATIRAVTPVFITNHYNDSGEIVIGKLEELGSGPVGWPWSSFYWRRLQIMREFLAGFVRPVG